MLANKNRVGRTSNGTISMMNKELVGLGHNLAKNKLCGFQQVKPSKKEMLVQSFQDKLD